MQNMKKVFPCFSFKRAFKLPFILFRNLATMLWKRTMKENVKKIHLPIFMSCFNVLKTAIFQEKDDLQITNCPNSLFLFLFQHILNELTCDEKSQ